MAKASVSRVCDECGAEFERIKICTNRREANRWEEWVAGQPALCPSCYAKAKAAARAEANAEANATAAKKAAEDGLPPLVGSEKQVAWANSLREESISHLRNRADAVSALKDMALVEARYWIDNRYDLWGVSEKIAKEIQYKRWLAATPERRAEAKAKRQEQAQSTDPFKASAAECDLKLLEEFEQRLASAEAQS